MFRFIKNSAALSLCTLAFMACSDDGGNGGGGFTQVDAAVADAPTVDAAAIDSSVEVDGALVEADASLPPDAVPMPDGDIGSIPTCDSPQLITQDEMIAGYTAGTTNLDIVQPSACGAATNSPGRYRAIHLPNVDLPIPKSAATRSRDNPLVSAIRTASCLNSSECFIISTVSSCELKSLR